MTTGEKIYGLRRKRGLSQEQLADEINVSRQSVSKWESGLALPETDKIIQLSDVLGVSTDYLLKAEVIDEKPVGAGTAAPDGFAKEGKQDLILTVVGIMVVALGFAGFMVFWITSVVRPASFGEDKGILGYLLTYRLTPLFVFCLTVMVAGVCLLTRKKLKKLCQKLIKIFRPVELIGMSMIILSLPLWAFAYQATMYGAYLYDVVVLSMIIVGFGMFIVSFGIRYLKRKKSRQ